MKHFLRYPCKLILLFCVLPIYSSLIQDLHKLTQQFKQLEARLVTEQKYIGTYTAFIMVDASGFRSLYPYTTTGLPGQKLKNLLDRNGFQYLQSLGNSLSRTRRDTLHLTLATFTVLVPQNQQSELQKSIFQTPGLEKTIQNILDGPLGNPIRTSEITLKFKQFTVFQRFLVAEFEETPTFTNFVMKIGTALQEIFSTAHFKFPPGKVRPHISLARFAQPLDLADISYLQQHLSPDLPTTLPDIVIREPLVISVTPIFKIFKNPLDLNETLQT